MERRNTIVKNVFIITIHTGFNFGSVLQAIATCNVLKLQGYSPVIINYIQNAYTYREYFRKSVQSLRSIARGIKRLPLFIANNLIYTGYLRKNVKMTSPIYEKDNFSEKMNSLINTYGRGYFLTGSDQVWNTFFNGYDLRYFFNGLKGIKVSYASSIGKTDLDERDKKMLCENLKDYRAISVRESSAVMILNSLGYNATLLLDPTFMLDRDQWKTYQTAHQLVKERYILMYLPYNINDKDVIFNSARKLAKEKRLEIVTFSWGYSNDKYADHTIRFASPGDFLRLMMDADYVFTNSFHGTAFSINLNKQFWVYMPTQFTTRIQSILDFLHLQCRVLDKEITSEQISKEIIYDDINKKLSDERAKSYYFIANSLK